MKKQAKAPPVTSSLVPVPLVDGASRTDGTVVAKLTWTSAQRFLAYYRPHKALLLADLLCAVIVAMTALSLPIVANYVTSLLLVAEKAADDVFWQICMAGGLMCLLLLVEVVCTLVVDYKGHVMGAKIEGALRKDLFEHCQRLSFAFYDKQRVGQLMSRITNDTFALGELFHHGPEDIIIALLKFVGATIILSVIDWQLTLAILAFFPLAVVMTLYFNGKMNRALVQSRVLIARVNERVEDSLSGIRVVQAFGRTQTENARFDVENRRFLLSRGDGYLAEALFSVATLAFSQLVTIAVLVIGSVRVHLGNLSIADLMTFLMCVAILMEPIKRLANFIRLCQEGYSGFTRALEILSIAPEIQERSNPVSLPITAGHIEFDKVSFAYSNEYAEILKNLSLDVSRGELVAIVGASGVGKSTLCALIPRFYDVTSGTVRIDGIDVRDYALENLRAGIGIVQQDVYLFSGTVRENLRYGREDATDEEIVAAAKAANAHEFITALPKGYDTEVGQRGVQLSGGQRQRLTIARVFLKDPAILIFDEATSALDNESERGVQAALLDLARDRTTLVIAHRLSTVQKADRILVLSGGQVVEQGTHTSLIADGGAYAALHDAQARI